MTEKQKARMAALEQSVKDLGVWLGRISHNGDFNPAIKQTLQNARDTLRMPQ